MKKRLLLVGRKSVGKEKGHCQLKVRVSVFGVLVESVGLAGWFRPCIGARRHIGRMAMQMQMA